MAAGARQSVIESLPAGAVSDPMVIVNIGIVMMNKKQPDAARAYFSKAIVMDAARPEPYYYRELAAIQAGKGEGGEGRSAEGHRARA